MKTIQYREVMNEAVRTRLVMTPGDREIRRALRRRVFELDGRYSVAITGAVIVGAPTTDAAMTAGQIAVVLGMGV